MNEGHKVFDPTAAVKAWRIVDVGRRPLDFLMRDNLFGSLIRDPRAFEFQRLLRRPEPWMEETLSHLAPGKARQALPVVVLDYVHKRLLASLFCPADTGRPFEETIEEFGRLWACPPTGALLEKRTGRGKAKMLLCGAKRLCPWCHSREVVRLYEALAPHFAESARHRLLVRLRATLVAKARIV